mmetsp:Transcript_5687/g.12655  ORF Transcript_5687/g.12655 Transcript_5687/m.12655 type:complete len:100 (-) Transcript_5687:385-684(-)
MYESGTTLLLSALRCASKVSSPTIPLAPLEKRVTPPNKSDSFTIFQLIYFRFGFRFCIVICEQMFCVCFVFVFCFVFVCFLFCFVQILKTFEKSLLKCF